MASFTPNLNLTKPGMDDPVDINTLNGNFDIIDEMSESITSTEICLGSDASIIYGPSSVAIGHGAKIDDQEAIAIGKGSDNAVYRGIAIGSASKGKTGMYCLAIGAAAEVEGSYGVAIGAEATSKSGGIAIGAAAEANKAESLALGSSAGARGIRSISLGVGVSVSGDYAIAIAAGPSSHFDDNKGMLGGSGSYVTNDWYVPGDFAVGGNKAFVIDHPHPGKRDTHDLRHGAVESPLAQNLYRYLVEVGANNGDPVEVQVQLPDYFPYLNSSDVQVWVSPVKHFGRGYGEVSGDILTVTCDSVGKYNILIIGTRGDSACYNGPEVKEKGVRWDGRTEAFSVKEIIEVKEIMEVA